jgi:hypothetical protein
VNFTVTTSTVSASTAGTITASYAGTSKTATLSVQPAAAVKLLSVMLNPTAVTGGLASVGIVTLSGPAPADGIIVLLTSSNSNKASVPPSVTVSGGNVSATFQVTTAMVTRKSTVTITASYAGVTKKAGLTIRR